MFRGYKGIIVLISIMIISVGVTGCTLETSYEESIPEVVATQVDGVINKDAVKYLSTVDMANKEYYREQERWIHDIAVNDITDYKLEIVEMKPVDESKVVVTLNQQYKYKYKDYDITYDNIYIKTKDGWKDSDIDFQTMETEKFIFKYIEGDENLDKVIKSAEKAYSSITNKLGREPEEKVLIKVYNDRELLRQATKLSVEWQFTGYYEMYESLKVFSGRELGYSYEGLIEHELTHKITMEDTNNNMPYWFAEGLATHFVNFPLRGGDPIELGWYTKKDFNLTIEKLEKIELERLTEDYDVGRYYGVSGMIIKYIELTYGRDKIFEIINELGKHEYNDVITNSNFEEDNIKKLDDAFEKTLNKTKEEISNEWLEWLNSL